MGKFLKIVLLYRGLIELSDVDEIIEDAGDNAEGSSPEPLEVVIKKEKVVVVEEDLDYIDYSISEDEIKEFEKEDA